MLSLLLYVSSFPMHSFCHIFPFTTTKELLQIKKELPARQFPLNALQIVTYDRKYLTSFQEAPFPPVSVWLDWQRR
jgi:hypothetical protein